MKREKVIELVKLLRAKGKSYREISELLPREWKGSRKPGTIQRWILKPPSDSPKASKPKAGKTKRKYSRRPVAIELPAPSSGTGKVLIMMCSIEQARELLG